MCVHVVELSHLEVQEGSWQVCVCPRVWVSVCAFVHVCLYTVELSHAKLHVGSWQESEIVELIHAKLQVYVLGHGGL